MQKLLFLFWYLTNFASLLILIFPFAFILLLPMSAPIQDADAKVAKNIGVAPTKKMKKVSAPLSRGAGFIENLFIYLERRNLFQCVSISVRISPHSLTRELAYSALRHLVLKYPLLLSFPEGEGRKLRWQPLEEIRFFDVFELDEDVDVCFTDPGADTTFLTKLAVTHNHHQKRALWKLTYFKHTGWLSFQSAHCFTDGASVVAYLKEFVELLNTVEVVELRDNLFKLERDFDLIEHGISPHFFECIKFRPDYPSSMALLALKAAVWLVPAIVPTLFETFMQNSYFVNRNPVPFSARSFFQSPHVLNPESPLNHATTSFINIPNEELATMIKRCRIHGVKLSTYVLFVYVHTVHEVSPGTYLQKFLNAAVAVNLRNFYPKLSNHKTYLGSSGTFDDGFYSHLVKYFIEPGTLFSWQALRKYHDFLHNTISRPDWIRQYYIASHAITAENYMGPHIDAKKDDSFLFLTNLGKIEFLEHESPEKFQIEDMLFSPSIGATLGTHHVALCSTKKSGLNIGFTNGDEKIKDWGYFRFKFKENLIHFSREH